MPDQRDLVRARFTRTAEQFASFSLSTRSAEADRLVALASPRGDELALDLACGPGTFTRAFAARVKFIHGLDITPALLDQARVAAAKEHLANCIFECGDAYSLPYAAAKFDLASCAYALHHMENPAAAMKELARVVRPGGRLALVDIFVPDGCDPAVANAIERARDASHCSTLLRGELLALCTDAGFRVSSSEPAERLRSFNDWMHIAGWLPGDPAYAATRRLMEADVSAGRSGFHPRPASTPAVEALLAAPAFIDSSADFDFIQPSLFVVAENRE
jgi:ubiquinone/menaquinone biosynthesis C-methylase UbiE